MSRHANIDLLPVWRRRLFFNGHVGEESGLNNFGPEQHHLLKIPEAAAQRDLASTIHGDRVKARSARRRVGNEIHRVEVGRLVLLEVLQKAQLPVNRIQRSARRLGCGDLFLEEGFQQQRLHIRKNKASDQKKSGEQRPLAQRGVRKHKQALRMCCVLRLIDMENQDAAVSFVL